MAIDWSQHFSARATKIRASEIRELLKLLAQPDITSFAGGIPDAALFPTSAIANAAQAILSDPQRAAQALQYSISEGYIPLREWLVTYMAQRGLKCGIDNILITNGSQQALDFLGKLFITPGDQILTASPTYLGALQAFNVYEPVYDRLPEAGCNRASDSYRNAAGHAPKFGYVMPEFQNPTGTSMTLEVRNNLLDFSDALDLPLIEDNAYECLRYDGDVVPSLAALAAERAGGIEKSRVIYCGTFSKSIVPALRIGWVVAPKPVIDKLVLIMQASSLHVSTFNQMLMYDVASQLIDRHVVAVRAIYKQRRDAMLAALEKYMPATVTWTKPQGGMFVWVTLPPDINSKDLLKRAIEEARVAFVPGAAFHPDHSGHNSLRLSFSLGDPNVIDDAIKRLAGLVAQSVSDNKNTH